MTAGVVVHALEVLRFIRSLTLRQCCNISWTQLKKLDSLQELRLFDCNINDEQLADVIDGDKLTSLQIHGCLKLSSKSLEHISQLKSLNKLDYFRTIGEDATSLRHIGNMKNLTHLKIGCDSSDVLVHLCCSLTQLKELTLTKSQVTDTGLRCISELTALTRLVLHVCPALTSKCLDSVSTLPNLRFFSFDASLCFRGGDIDKLSCLNDILTLKEINVTSKPESLAGILKCLCRGKTWQLRYEPTEVARSHHVIDHYVLSC